MARLVLRFIVPKAYRQQQQQQIKDNNNKVQKK